MSFSLVTHTSRSKEEIETNSVDKVPEPTLINYSGPPIVKVIDKLVLKETSSFLTRGSFATVLVISATSAIFDVRNFSNLK